MTTSLNLAAFAFAMVIGADFIPEGHWYEPVAAPAPAEQRRIPPQDTSRSRRTNTTTIQHIERNGSNATEINYRGQVKFTEDERDIQSITPGGFFKFSKTTFGNTRSVLIESASDGTLSRTYYAGRQEQPYEPEGRKWLSDVLPEVIATSGIGAEERVKRIYAKKGVNGVLEAIDRLESDHVESIYFGYLLEQPNLGDKNLSTLLAKLTEKVGSDHEKANLLRRVSGTYLRNDQTSQEYIRAVSSLGSDHEKGQVFRHILSNTKLNEANAAAVVRAVGEIGSDHEKAQVVRFLLQQNKLNGPGLQQALTVIGTIGSDHEKAAVLRQLFGNQTLAISHFKTLAGVMGQIGSDHEKSSVINHLVNHNLSLVTAHFEEVLGLTKGISSDHEKSNVLSNLLSKYQPAEKQYVYVLQSITSIQSDHEKGQLLAKLAKTLPKGNTSVVDAYKKAVKSIQSDHEYRRAMEAIE